MSLRWLLAVLLLVCVAWVGAATAWQLSQVGVHQGYAPQQPIAFSHKLHAGDTHIPCLYCHFGARRGRHAGIPPANVCMNCHSILKRQSVEIEKLKEWVERRRPIEWIKVHNLPDFVYFDHSRHVLSDVPCQECHGPVESMERVRQWAPLTMAWCLDCHRRRATAALTRTSVPHDLGLQANLDCGKCHY